MRAVVEGVLASQRSRAVAPKEGLEPLQFRLRGRLLDKWTDETFELVVVNTDGNTQPAASFHEYVRFIFGELVALRDAITLKFRGLDERDEDDEYWSEGLESLWGVDLRPGGGRGIQVCPCFGTGADGMVLAALQIPWPLGMLLDVMNVSQLDDLGDTRRRFETNKLRLVLSKIPRLSGVEYLFKEFYTAAPAPSTRDELQYVMDQLASSWMELAGGGGQPMDTFRSTIRCPTDDGFEAEGVLATYFDGARWAVGKAAEFPPGDWEGPEAVGDY